MTRRQLLSAAGGLALLGAAWTGDTYAAETSSGTEVTGIVTQADKQARWIVVDGQTYTFPETGGGDAGMPAAGEKVTLSYRESGGKRAITKLGQAKQQRPCSASEPRVATLPACASGERVGQGVSWPGSSRSRFGSYCGCCAASRHKL